MRELTSARNPKFWIMTSFETRCNICGNSDWGDFASRKGIKCNKCGSLERTRLQYLHMQRLGIPKPGMKILHIAPEVGLANVFRKVEGVDYRPVDFCPEIYTAVKPEKFDLCADGPKLESNSLDLIVHNHVLEHIFCDVTGIMLHLHRALKPGGYHLFSIPLYQNKSFDEYFGQLSEAEAVTRFGQKDHCRTFSVLNLDETFGMILDVDLRSFIPGKQFSPEELRSINFPEPLWSMLDGSSTMVLRKEDCIFEGTRKS